MIRIVIVPLLIRGAPNPCPISGRYAKRNTFPGEREGSETAWLLDPPIVNMSRLRSGVNGFISASKWWLLCGKEMGGRTERRYTRIVSVHGALLLLQMGADVGEVLTVTNVRTQEEALCRVVNLECSDEPGMQEVGIEFTEPAAKFGRLLSS